MSQEDIGGTIALVAMVGFIIGAVALIRPIQKIKLGTRKRAGLMMAAAFVLFFVGASIMPKPTPEMIAAREAEAARTRATDEKAASDQAAAQAQQAEAQAQQNKGAITAAAKGLWDQVTVQVSACDQASKNVAQVAGRRNPSIYDLYPMVQEANGVCRAAGSRVRDLDVPDVIPRQHREAFAKALKTCSDAYYVKASAFDSMGKVLNGDARPSAVTEAREASEAAQAGTMLCGVGFLQAVTGAGLSTSEVMGTDFAME